MSTEIDGGGGNDTIDGADGADSLVGGAGADVIRAFGGDDQVSVDDGVRDVAGCGLGTDSIVIDLQDSFDACESRRLVGAVGVLRLTPRTLLRARAGETAWLRLSWTHPRSWKQLRQVELRLYHGPERGGRVTVRIRGGRIESRHVRLVRRARRITSKGKAVSARLALRLGRSLAGRRLRLEVAALDTAAASRSSARPAQSASPAETPKRGPARRTGRPRSTPDTTTKEDHHDNHNRHAQQRPDREGQRPGLLRATGRPRPRRTADRRAR